MTMNLFLAVINGKFEEANNLVTDNDFGYDPNRIAQTLRNNLVQPFIAVSNRPSQVTPKVRHLFNQGDDELVERFKYFQASKNSKSLTVNDLYTALAKPPEKLLKRVMRRFDEDGSGTIELQELERMQKVIDGKEKWQSTREAVKNVTQGDPRTVEERLQNLEYHVDRMLALVKNKVLALQNK